MFDNTPFATLASHLDAQACYAALQTRDARFDGRFFTGVRTTGIYCRPVCKVRLPQRANCLFFSLAAQAESAGYRPCLRCRPELAPALRTWSLQDGSSILALQAARLLDTPEAWVDTPSMKALATRMGISDRHLRRIFETQFGVSPLQYLQTQRLLTAKQLLADTCLPMSSVALQSGFASVRRFNAAFAAHYAMAPSRIRQRVGTHHTADTGGLAMTVQLAYRPPYDVQAMLAFMRLRLLEGVEALTEDGSIVRTVVLRGASPSSSSGKTANAETTQDKHGWIRCRFDEPRCRVTLEISDGLAQVVPHVISRVRDWLDLDADIGAIERKLGADFPQGMGQRVPGTLDGFELAVRAVLGQQITVTSARTLAQRLVQRFGLVVATPYPALTRCFPSPSVLAQASGDALGQLGIVKTRQKAILQLAQWVAEQRISLHPGVNLETTRHALLQIPGIGEWTAQYITMRALRWPDAFPSGDVALQKALGVPNAQSAEAMALAWQPWRSYAVVRSWARLATTRAATRTTPR